MYPVPYLSVSDFLSVGEGLVRFSTAPDGLPLLTRIAPPPQAESLLYAPATALGMESPPASYVGTPLESVAAELRRLLQDRYRCPMISPDGKDDTALILPRPLRDLGGFTLMERLFYYDLRTVWPGAPMSSDIGATGPGTPAPGGTQPDTRFPPVGNPPQVGAPPPGMSAEGSTGEEGAPPPTLIPWPAPNFRPGIAYLGVRTSDARLVVLRRESTPGEWPRFAYRREYQAESLTSLDGGTLDAAAYSWAGAQTQRLSPDDIASYERLRASEPGALWQWTVPRNAVARAILQLAERLDARHAIGEIHGDLKPANILLTNDGPVAIDSLEIPAGQRSPGMTRGWAAPEQVLGLPVSPATDQYPLGLLLLALVQGVLYGEEVTVSIPIGGRQLERHTLLRNPGVFIDPTTAPIRTGWADAWRELIEQTVRYDPAARFPTLRHLATALRPLVEEETLTGEQIVPLYFGELLLVESENGNARPAWLI